MNLTIQNKIKIYSTLFFVGFCGLVIEVSGTRILAPVYGYSVYVWTSLIVTVLIGLAVGYHLGGKISGGERFKNVTPYLLLAVSFWILCVLFFDGTYLKIILGLGYEWGPLVAALSFFCMPMILLGAIGPLSVQYVVSDIRLAGKATGDVYSWETFGAITGTLVTAYLFFPNLIIDYIFIIVSIILAILSLIWFLYEK